MFEQSFVATGKTKTTTGVMVGFIVQVAVVAILILIPLIRYEVLPSTTLTSFLVAPPPPPPVKKEEPKPATPQRIRVGGNVQQARLVRQPRPSYPPLAKQARIQGVVKLSAIISKDGTVQHLEVISGHPLLVPSALEAVKPWVYQPTLLNGEPVEVVTQIDVNFTLSQ
jgi:protein TonB